MKKLIILIFVFFVSLYAKSDNRQDTAVCHLEIKDSKLINAISSCIEELEYWNINNNKITNNKSGKVIHIHSTNKAGELELRITNPTRIDHKLTELPDKYSYLEGYVLFWFFGVSKLEKPDDFLINHMQAIYDKFKTVMPEQPQKEPINQAAEVNTTNESEVKKSLGPGLVTAKEIEELGITVTPAKIKSPRTNRIPPSPILILKVDDKGNIRMDRLVENFF